MSDNYVKTVTVLLEALLRRRKKKAFVEERGGGRCIYIMIIIYSRVCVCMICVRRTHVNKKILAAALQMKRINL